MAELTLTVTNRAISLPQSTPQQITNTEYIDKVKFNCDAEFDNYTLVAIFRNGKNGACYPAAVPADRSAVDIDPRALRRKGYLYIGMYGLNGLKVLPTLWAPPIEIKEGVDTSATEDPEAPVPSIYAALVARVGALEASVNDLEDDVDALDVAVDELDEDVEELQTTVDGKQDIIADLSTIRSGAALGATALQSVPMATQNTIGGVKVHTQSGWDGYGIKANDNGFIYIARAGDNTIDQRTNEYNPIVPKTVDKAVLAALSNPKIEYTDNQKEEACATIGAVSHFDGFRKIIDYTTTASETNVITFTNDDEGEPISLQYEDIIIKTYFPHGTASGDVRIFTRETDTSWNPANMILYYSSGYMVHVSDNRYTMAYIKNVWRGAWTTIKQTSATSITQYAATACNPSNAFCEIDGEMIRRFRFALATSAGAFPSGGKIEIYVK